jgi:hypothetical protein
MMGFCSLLLWVYGPCDLRTSFFDTCYDSLDEALGQLRGLYLHRRAHDKKKRKNPLNIVAEWFAVMLRIPEYQVQNSVPRPTVLIEVLC